jgi:sorting nexin-1/2
VEVILTSEQSSQPQQNGILSSSITRLNIIDEKTMQAHVVYLISTQYPNEQTSVVARRFSDFQWLQGILEEEHLDILIPPIPEKDALFRFDNEVLAHRKREFNKFLNRIITHPILSKSKHVDTFLNAKDEDLIRSQVKPTTLATLKETFTLNNVLEAVSKVGQVMITEVEEIDDYFFDESDYGYEFNEDLLHVQEDSLSSINIVKAKNALIREIVECLNVLSGDFEYFQFTKDQTLSAYLKNYVELLSNRSKLSENLVENQIAKFDDALGDQMRIIVATQRLFDNRENLLLDYQIAENTTRFNGDASTEKLALEKQEAEEKLRAVKEKFIDSSRKVKEQCEEGRKKKTQLLTEAIRALALENIEYNEKAIELWKEFRTSIGTK